MISPRKTALILVVVVCSTLGNSVAIAQVSESPRQADTFTGIHRNKGINGAPETVTITDGTTHTRITEQEYRERGYTPEFHSLPTLIVKRLRGPVAVSPDNRN
jgi:hypothetical protein